MNAFRCAFRSLNRQRTLSAVVVLILAMGVAASASVFSVVNGLILEPLAYRDPDRLLHIQSSIPSRGVPEFAISTPEYLDYREQSIAFEDIAAYYGSPQIFNLSTGGEPERLTANRVSVNFFEVLGVTAAFGRTFLKEEQGEGTARVVILTDELWRGRLGADPEVLSRTLVLDDVAYQIVGVLPAGFSFRTSAVEAYLPFEFDLAGQSRRMRQFRAIGRLREGQSLESGRRDIAAIARRLQETHPEHNTDFEANVVPLFELLYGPNFKSTWAVALAAVICLLGISLANVVNLQVTRALRRQADIVTRRALGASLRRAVAPVAAEGFLLSVAGGALALWIAWTWGVPLVTALLPPELPRLDAVAMDTSVLGFAVLLAVVTAGLAGLLPAAFLIFGNHLDKSLQPGARGSSRRSASVVHGGLVVVEVGLALGLLLASGTFLASLARLQAVERGVHAGGVLSVRLTAPEIRFPEPAQITGHLDRIVEGIRALPAVESAAIINELPAVGYINWAAQFTVEGTPPPPPGQEPIGHARIIGPGYFKLMGISLREGRDFAAGDRFDGPPVVVVNRTLGELYFPDGSAVGRFLLVRNRAGIERRQIVGVVSDVRQAGIREPIRQALYFPYTQRAIYTTSIVLKTTLPPQQVVPDVRAAVAAVDNRQALYRIETVDAALAEETVMDRALARLLAVLVAAGVLLAAAGLYGVVAHATAQRGGEIAIRMAVGADARSIFGLVVKRSLWLTGGGVILGLGAWALSGPSLTPLLYEVNPLDPGLLAALMALLVVVSLAATIVPARQATRIEPVRALRQL